MKSRILRYCALIITLMTLNFTLNGCFEEKTLKIGLIAPTTGEYSAYGTAFVNGVKMYADEVNSADGVSGYKIELAIRDDKGDPTEALNYYHLLSSEVGVCSFLGPLTDSAAEVINEANRDKGYPCLMPAYIGETGIEDTGNPSFGLCADSAARAGSIVRFASKRLDVKSAAVVYLGGDSESETLYNDIVSEAITYGIMITGDCDYSEESGGELDEKLAELAAKDSPEAIFLALSCGKTSEVCAELRSCGYVGELLSANVLPATNIGTSLDGVYGVGYYPRDTVDEGDDFRSGYLAANGAEPDSYAALGYDCARILISSLEKALSEKSAVMTSSDSFRQKVASAVASTDGYFKSGNVSFKGEESAKDCVILRAAEGRLIFCGKY